MPKISVIIPVYNAEKYLDQCLQSVLSQSFTDFELLLINDGSKDRSGEICEGYAEKDSRIQVFHQENKGVSAARNLGLDHAKGEWITFVDSDDWIGENYLLDFINLNQDSDIIYFNTISFKNQKGIPMNSFNNNSYSVDYFFENYMVTSLGYVHSKFFKFEIINVNNIRFDIKLSFAEDCIFILQCLKYCKEIYLSSCSNYYYRDTPGSLVKKTYSYDKELYLLNKSREELTKTFHFLKLNTSTGMFYKEFQYYAFRVLRSNSKINKKAERQLNLKFLIENYKYELLYVYKNARGKGYLLFLSIKIGNVKILDFLIQKIYS